MLAYLAHPVGESNGEDSIRRADNIANALAWVAFFANTTQWSLMAPWHLYALVNGVLGHQRRLMHSLEILERCDILILVGGHISGHMRLEMDRAKRRGIPILDLTVASVSPPEPDEDATQHILGRARRAVLAQPRRVWLPRLTDDDMIALRDARHTLYTAMPDEHPAAVAILDRIMMAASETP